MDELGKLMRDQQALRDDTFRSDQRDQKRWRDMNGRHVPAGRELRLRAREEGVAGLFRVQVVQDAGQAGRSDSRRAAAHALLLQLQLEYAAVLQDCGAGKRRYPGTVVVFGGPNFPSVAEEQADYLKENTAIDFYVQMEGEFALVELVRRLDSVNYDAALLKSTGARILNTVYVWNGSVVAGPVERIQEHQTPSRRLTSPGVWMSSLTRRSSPCWKRLAAARSPAPSAPTG